MDPVKFVALDKEDLEVVSAHLQDAEIKVADVHWHHGGHVSLFWARGLQGAIDDTLRRAGMA